jgi:hypothetical protein
MANGATTENVSIATVSRGIKILFIAILTSLLSAGCYKDVSLYPRLMELNVSENGIWISLKSSYK